MSDRIFGVFGFLLAVFYIWQATQIELSFISDPFGPKAFPFMIGTVLARSLGVILSNDRCTFCVSFLTSASSMT